MKMKTSKTIKVENVEINTNGEEKVFSGNVKLTWKTKKVLSSILDLADKGLVSFDMDIKFDKIRGQKELQTFPDGVNAMFCGNDNGGWRSNSHICTESSMNKANGWCGRELRKLKALGIIDWVNCGDGDWDSAWISFGENPWDAILEFEDIISKNELEDEKDQILQSLNDSFDNAINQISKLGLGQSKNEIRIEARESIRDFHNAKRDDELRLEENADKIKALKNQIAELKK